MDVMSRKPGAFHRKHGTNVKLFEEDTVADGLSFSDTVVFTSQLIPQGSMFQVKLLKRMFLAGAMVSGV